MGELLLQVEFLLPVVPLLVLVGSLLCGFYPGYRAAMRLAQWIFSPAPRRRVLVARRPRSLPARPIRGGLLLAFGLAQRPPPLAP